MHMKYFCYKYFFDSWWFRYERKNTALLNQLCRLLCKLIMPLPQGVIEGAIGLDFQFIHNADEGKINRHELLIAHGKRGFTRAHDYTQITGTGLHYISSNLKEADRFQLFVQRLDNQ